MPRRSNPIPEETGEETVASIEEEPEHDDVAAELARLGAELQAVAGDKLARESKLKEVERTLGKLRIEDYESIADSPVIQKFVNMFGKSEDMRPGEVRNKGTLAEVMREWTWGDINMCIKSGEMHLVKFVPSENLPITFQGLTLHLRAGKMVEVPNCFYDIYMDHLNAVEQAQINEQWLMGMSSQPPNRNWITPESAIVRAHSMQGDYRGLKSGFLGTGPIREDNTTAGGGNAE